MQLSYILILVLASEAVKVLKEKSIQGLTKLVFFMFQYLKFPTVDVSMPDAMCKWYIISATVGGLDNLLIM